MKVIDDDDEFFPLRNIELTNIFRTATYSVRTQDASEDDAAHFRIASPRNIFMIAGRLRMSANVSGYLRRRRGMK